MAENNRGLMQNESVLFLLPLISTLRVIKSCELYVCGATTLYAGEKIKGRKGGADTREGLRQKRGQAAFTLTHHWMALCALTK